MGAPGRALAAQDTRGPADCVPCTTLTLTDSTEQPQQQSAVGAEALLDTLLLAGLARRALARV